MRSPNFSTWNESGGRCTLFNGVRFFSLPLHQSSTVIRGIEEPSRVGPYLEASLEGKLKLGSLDDDVGEIEQMDFERIQHSLSGDDDLLGLFLYRKRTNQSRDLNVGNIANLSPDCNMQMITKSIVANHPTALVRRLDEKEQREKSIRAKHRF